MQVTKPLKRYSEKSRKCRTGERLRLKCTCQYFCDIFNISFYSESTLPKLSRSFFYIATGRSRESMTSEILMCVKDARIIEKI